MNNLAGASNIKLMGIVSILSLSLVVNIPGLAITPVIERIKQEFQASALEVQLLAMLPNICIVPTMLLSNRLCLRFSKTSMMVTSMAIFTLCGMSFFFVNDIVMLIILSCVLGIACGISIPLDASMITDISTGTERIRLLGYKSGVANLSLVFATFIVGWLASKPNWRLPFLVYLVSVIPLLFVTWFHKMEQKSNWKAIQNDSSKKSVSVGKNSMLKKLNWKKLVPCMAFYFFLTYTVMVLPFYLGLDESILRISNEWNGAITAMFYMAIFISGAFIGNFIRVFKNRTLIVSLVLLTAGTLFIVVLSPPILMCLCGFTMGIGYGVIQPIIYAKAASVATDRRLTTLALSIVMCMNYFSIALAPLIIDSIRSIFDTTSNIAPFYINFVIDIIVLIIIIVKRNSFVFSIDNEYHVSTN